MGYPGTSIQEVARQLLFQRSLEPTTALPNHY